MKAPFSDFLASRADGLKKLVSLLERNYSYVSLLATDSPGFALAASRKVKSVSWKTMTTERGCVVRVYRDGQYSEVAFNMYDPEKPEEIRDRIEAALEEQRSLLAELGIKPYETPMLPDEPETLFVEMETGRLPEKEDIAGLISSLSDISAKGIAEGASDGSPILECQVRAQSTHISKMFLTKNRDLRQSYVYSEGTVACVGVRDDQNKMSYEGISGRVGPELFDDLGALLPKTQEVLADVLSAEKPEPGEYDVITAPDVTGLIAHEAFGHGVEMDMFVKKRALGADYIGKRVGSSHVTMHEGALCDDSVTGYAFDDEGTLAGDTVEIEKGILKTGICDALSALRLSAKPTGNGKRENFEHKVYTRMTNTLFDSGEDTLEDMIASIKSGYLLRGSNSGMEDPKHWGIQCIVERGYEIKDGALTGKVISPVVMTGYVPDLLGSISMVSGDRGVYGNGGCGKGYKEWVKVADGGPYLKARARLG